MTLEEKRIALAEACGWVMISRGKWRGPDGLLYENWSKSGMLACPDFYNDLNALHEVEMSHILPIEGPDYYHALEDIIGKDQGVNLSGGTGFSGWIAHASAPQRFEALGRTLGLWT